MELFTQDTLVVCVNQMDSLKHLGLVTNFLHSLRNRVYKLNRTPPFGEILAGWTNLIELNYGLQKIDFHNYNGTKTLNRSHGVIFHYAMFVPVEQTELLIKTVIKVLKANKHIEEFNVFIGKGIE